MSKQVHMDDAVQTIHEKPMTEVVQHEDNDHEDALHSINTRGTDTEKGSLASHGAEGAEHRAGLHLSERRLLMKLDFAILPFAILLYLSAYLDRGNMGNARLAGLEAQALDGSDTKYSIALSCFFITYIVLSIPGTLLAKQIDPSKSIAAGALIWSIAATCQAAVHNPAGVYVCRLFIGVGEACFGQAMALYLTYFYTKNDLAKRIGCFISAGAVAGAFGGLIAFGVTSIKHPKIDNWRILFLIEGLPSFVLAVCVFLFMPSRPESTRLLNEDQRTLCLTRLNAQNLQESGLGIDWRGVKRALTDWKIYVTAVCYSCMNLGLGSVGGFLPSIIKGFGYSNARAQLMTVPPYVVALVLMLMVTSFSDWRQTRGIPAACIFLLGLIGWVVLYSVDATLTDHKKGIVGATSAMLSGRYFACIAVVCAGYVNIPIIMAWVSSNSGNQSQRATSLGMLNTLGQCLSIAASFLFPSKEGPQFKKGCKVNLAFQALGFVIAMCMTFYYRHENKRRDKVEGGPPPKGTPLDVIEMHDLAPGFRYTV